MGRKKHSVAAESRTSDSAEVFGFSETAVEMKSCIALDYSFGEMSGGGYTSRSTMQ